MTYTVLGATDEFTACELCGRDDLKGTVALRDENGDVAHFGSDCAARALGWTGAKVRKAAERADRRAEAARVAFARYGALYGVTVDECDRASRAIDSRLVQQMQMSMLAAKVAAEATIRR